MTPRSWEKWVERYEGKGYRVLAPAYPGLEVEALNEDPSPIEALTVPTIIEHYEGIIDALGSPPIIMGHSAGGLFTQILLNHGYGAAGVVPDRSRKEHGLITGVRGGRILLSCSTLATAKDTCCRKQGIRCGPCRKQRYR
jgi:pimeloyl-ACP methyl ester carboxylesterase